MVTFGKKTEGVECKKRLGVYAVIFEEDKIAIIRTPKGYFLPGGGVNEHEEIEEALRREVIEELGWEIRIKKYIGEAKQFFSTGTNEKTYHESTGHFYIAGKTAETSEPVEADHRLIWMTIEDAVKNLYFEYQVWGVKESIK